MTLTKMTRLADDDNKIKYLTFFVCQSSSKKQGNKEEKETVSPSPLCNDDCCARMKK